MDLIENSDGATLTYVTAGLEFDPGPTAALGVIVRVDGENLGVTELPEGVTCEVEDQQLECRLGDVANPVRLGVTGGDVIANAAWRRAGANTVYVTFAHAGSAALGD